MKKKKILFLGESYRADAITWMNGLKEFGNFEIITWELKTPSNCLHNRILRIFEFQFAIFKIRELIKLQKPDMVIAERTTSYGFLAALSGVKPVAIAQQGRTDLWPETSLSLPLKKIIQHYAFQKADLIHAWGPIMTLSMIKAKVNMTKVLVLPKGIDLTKFGNTNKATPEKICAIVTRSLLPEYRHTTILKAFEILNQKGIDFELTVIGDGTELPTLKSLAKKLKIDKKVNFMGRIPNTELPTLLQKSNIYISMPITEGVSASLFEAMACYCYPIVTEIPGNKSWITHRENGGLVAIDDHTILANELIWSFENKAHREQAVTKNRIFVEENANYEINMKIIAHKYHELINSNLPN
ncbi:glycosyltransferase [Flavobacterium xanthum]|uniref:Protein involved in gliding motility RemC n=1 Tax=Flavobacterium xanthum TaxID=69322 RepID=A0A1M6WU20_9FLAO|nr:glycosyltransferase [Flavobacterium xanthum]SHK97272.1 protein involved in gliding motility RemC [Flavobacterium xanthum]